MGRWRPCETCDTQGPLEPTAFSAWIEAHRAIHRFAREVAEMLAMPVLRWLSRGSQEKTTPLPSPPGKDIDRP